MRAARTAIVLLMILCLIPGISLLSAALMARWAGCQLDPDTPLPCPIMGSDFGGPLFALADFGWLSVATFPVLVALLASWLLIELVHAAGKPPKRDIKRSPLRGSAPVGRRDAFRSNLS